MSHIYRKVDYQTEGAWGATETKTLYFHHNNTCDIVLVYDQNGKYIFSFDDTMKNNMFDAIVEGVTEWDEEKIIPMTPEEIKKLEP